MTQSTTDVSLYEQDFALWIDDTVAKLKAHEFEQIDLENLIEEVESLGRSDKRELESRLDVLLEHILKRTYVDSSYDNRGWEDTIGEQRKQLKRLLRVSPSLRNYFESVFTEIYQDAVSSVSSRYRGVTFPDDWQFSGAIDSILNDTFWQE